jgi:hypothetical protein
MVAQAHETAGVRGNGEGGIFLSLARVREEGNGKARSGREQGCSSSRWAAGCDTTLGVVHGGHVAAMA